MTESTTPEGSSLVREVANLAQAVASSLELDATAGFDAHPAKPFEFAVLVRVLGE